MVDIFLAAHLLYLFRKLERLGSISRTLPFIPKSYHRARSQL